MKAVLIVTGGVTGIPGKWEVDLSSDEAKRNFSPDELASLTRLVSEARAAGAFQKDFSGTSPDVQSYEFVLDGEHAKWSEPTPEGAEPIPAALKELKLWMMRNTRRQPYRP